jgi:hypothetical protein
MVRIKRSYRIQVCGTKMPQWRAPLGSSTDRQAPTRHRGMRKARLEVHRPSACSGVKALRNTSPAGRQAAKLCYRFGPLTPSARSANLIAGDGTKNGFPAPNKERAINQKHDLTGKAPYRFESAFLHRRVSNVPAVRAPCIWNARAPCIWNANETVTKSGQALEHAQRSQAVRGSIEARRSGVGSAPRAYFGRLGSTVK